MFVAILTVNWQFFVDIAAASFEVFSATLMAWSLVVTVRFSLCGHSRCSYCYIDIVLHPRHLLETMCLFHTLWANLVPSSKEAEEEKRAGFSRSCMHIIISYLITCTCGRAREKCFRCNMLSSLTPIVYSKFKQHAYLCASITMSVMNACLWTPVRSNNSVALFSTTGIQHKLTHRILHLLEASSNESIISHEYHPKTSFPLYTDSIADRYSGLGLNSGLSDRWRAYKRQRSWSSASDDVYEKSIAVLLLCHSLSDVSQ